MDFDDIAVEEWSQSDFQHIHEEAATADEMILRYFYCFKLSSAIHYSNTHKTFMYAGGIL